MEVSIIKHSFTKTNTRTETLHAFLGIGLDSKLPMDVRTKTRMKAQYNDLEAIITDEISMVGGEFIHMFNERLNTALNAHVTDDNSEENSLFGGIATIVFLGDFHQFEPVSSTAVWSEAKCWSTNGVTSKGKNFISGQNIWQQFDRVVILTESMRQSGDIQYQGLLARSRQATLTAEDVSLLNQQTMERRLAHGDPPPETSIVQRHTERHMDNRKGVEKFAIARNQLIYIFAAKHAGVMRESNRREGGRGDLLKSHQKLLQHSDKGSLKGPGLLMYTKDMPVMVLDNISTKTGIVNGLLGTASKIYLAANSRCFPIGDRYILVDRPPATMLITISRDLPRSFSGLAANEVPIFPTNSYGLGIIRTQLPVTPAFSITDYKSQGQTYAAACLDLKRQRLNTSNHKAYTSLVVQLGRVKSLDGVWIRDHITFADIKDCKPSPALLVEIQRLNNLDIATRARWRSISMIE